MADGAPRARPSAKNAPKKTDGYKIEAPSARSEGWIASVMAIKLRVFWRRSLNGVAKPLRREKSGHEVGASR